LVQWATIRWPPLAQHMHVMQVMQVIQVMQVMQVIRIHIQLIWTTSKLEKLHKIILGYFERREDQRKAILWHRSLCLIDMTTKYIMDNNDVCSYQLTVVGHFSLIGCYLF
jgi:hypothetical protein